MFGFIVVLFSSMLLYGCQVANLAKEIVLIPVAVTDGFLGTDIHRDIDSKIATLVNTNNQTSLKDGHQSRVEAPEPIKLAYNETSKSDVNKTLISHYVVNNGRITWSRGLINKGFKVAEGHIARRNDMKENNLGDALKYCSNLKDGHYISCIHNEVSDIDRLSVFEIADRLFYVKLSEDKQKISTEEPILLTYPSLQKNEFETTEQFNLNPCSR